MLGWGFAGVGWDTVVKCPDGTVALGGGFFSTFDRFVTIDISRAALSGQGWHVHAMNRTSTAKTIDAHVICAVPPGR